MSMWSYVNGTITVEPMGESQAERKYILDSVLAHLPKVSGSEGDMNVYVIQKNGYNESSNCDEFGNFSNLGNGYRYGLRRNLFEIQSEYIIVVNGALKDMGYMETLRNFNKWLTRLSKRIMVIDVFVNVYGDYEGSKIIKEHYGAYCDMFEYPSWYKRYKNSKGNWCERLMRNPKDVDKDR